MNPLATHLTGVLACGGAAGMLSAFVLAWRGRVEIGSAAAPVNAPSHWVWGRPALRRDDVTARHTLLGELVHQASSFFWGVFYELLQAWRREANGTTRLADAAAVTVLAAVVDLRVVPERLTPGFERRLSRRSVAIVYASFAVGLALGGAWMARRR
jgi:hypothetical protein